MPAAGVSPADLPGPLSHHALPTSLIDLMSCPYRRAPGTRTASGPTTSVIRVHVGRGAQRSSAAANAQHRGGSSGHRAHTEGRRHTLWAPHPVGGEQAEVSPETSRACLEEGGAQVLPAPSAPQAPPLGGGGGALLPGAVEQQQPQFVSRFLEGQSGVTIKHVACGDLFTACLTG